jgi:hypothetical protein
MSHQAPHQVTPRAPLPPATIEELLADPSRTRGLVLDSVPELLSQVALRVAALKTLEGALLSLMLSERIATKGLSHAASKLLGARELAELFGVPESWVREQAQEHSAHGALYGAIGRSIQRLLEGLGSFDRLEGWV